MEITNQTLHEILVRVEKQVTKTNGRVTDLEISRDEQAGAMRFIKVLIIPIILGIIMSFIIQEDKMQATIMIFVLIFILLVIILNQTNIKEHYKYRKENPWRKK